MPVHFQIENYFSRRLLFVVSLNTTPNVLSLSLSLCVMETEFSVRSVLRCFKQDECGVSSIESYSSDRMLDVKVSTEAEDIVRCSELQRVSISHSAVLICSYDLQVFSKSIYQPKSSLQPLNIRLSLSLSLSLSLYIYIYIYIYI
jgi:hypothetical protein